MKQEKNSPEEIERFAIEHNVSSIKYVGHTNTHSIGDSPLRFPCFVIDKDRNMKVILG